MTMKAKLGLPGKNGKNATIEERRAYRRAYMAQYVPLDREHDLKRKRNHWRKQNGLPDPSRAESSTCEICGGPPSGKGARLHLDHCHLTGIFRGWLCHRCNMALGLFKDSSDLCVAAARYLRKAQL